MQQGHMKHVLACACACVPDVGVLQASRGTGNVQQGRMEEQLAQAAAQLASLPPQDSCPAPLTLADAIHAPLERKKEDPPHKKVRCAAAAARVVAGIDSW